MFVKHSILITLTILLLSACGAATPKKDKLQYITFESYHDEVLPKIDEGYDVIEEEHYNGSENYTPDQLKAKARAKRADIIMVDSEFGIHNNTFDIYYLKKYDYSKLRFGAKFIKMPLHIRQKFNSNIGCTLGQVFYDTPAYKYDLHEFDIIIKADDEEVTSCYKLKEILSKRRSHINITIWADGQIIDIDNIKLNR